MSHAGTLCRAVVGRAPIRAILRSLCALSASLIATAGAAGEFQTPPCLDPALVALRDSLLQDGRSICPTRLDAAPAIDPRLTAFRLALARGGPSSLPGIAEDGSVSILAEGGFDRVALSSLGVQVGTEADGIVTARVPSVALPEFLAQPGLVRARLARPLELFLNQSAAETGANAMWGGTPPNYTGLTGRGVIIGIIDTGIDIAHADFKNAQNRTRILSIWEQGFNANPPAGFTYGTEWTAAQIDAGQCTENDGNGHGTFLASVAAGNGRATGNGQPAYQYVGVAPEADLVVVKSTLTDAAVLDGVNYVFRKATAQGKNAVVCIAAGTESGPHDGTDPLEQSLSALCGPGRIVCAAVGNYGQSAVHSQTSVSRTTPGTVTLRVPTYTSSPYFTDFVEIEGWYESGNNFSITVRAPNGTSYGPVAKGASLNQSTPSGYLMVANGTYTNSQGDAQVYFNVSRNGTNYVAQGLWTITVSAQTGSGQTDFWMTQYYLSGSTPAMEGGVSFEKTVVTPATGDSILSVAAYTTKVDWVAQNGRTYGLVGASQGRIASYSGKGLRRDGRQAPDVSAPGEAIGAARSSSMTASATRILPDGVHAIGMGTSAAAAHAAGAVALLLQQQPNRSVNAIRLLLRGSAKSDSYTGSVPNPTWGYGKLHVGSGQTPVADDRALSFDFALPFPNPSAKGTTFAFSLPAGEPVAPGTRLELRILDVRGRLVTVLRGTAAPGPQQLTWDGRTTGGTAVAPGLYFGKLQVGGQTSVRKFLRLGT